MSEEAVEESLAELGRLVTTLGFKVVGQTHQKQRTTAGATGVGAGKLRELIQLTDGKIPEAGPVFGASFGAPAAPELANVVVFDCDLKPAQMRHIESALGVEVLDRTGVIIEIFSRHAKTKAARLQVEIARLNYLSPRIREVGSSGERQAGRGSGESALTIERSRIRDRLAQLRRELAAVQRDQGDHRQARYEQRSVALVGYTNAGKSSTMRALTGSEVLVEDKLFATLDTTVRALKPETQPRILVSDTVGFIKKLPHDLVASFKSTLDEALNASLLLYVVDAADPSFRGQLEVVEEVLKDVGVKNTPTLLVLNKADQLDDVSKRRLAREFPDAILTSSLVKQDVRNLRDRIVTFFETDMVDESLFVSYEAKGMVGEIRNNMRVIRETNGDEGITFTVRARAAELARFKRKFGIAE
ncbi:MAG: GTPase HflX [Proteobacteria bacterium]|nr:MAG: GTPase HflX [Pseudomonadota bacterium]